METEFDNDMPYLLSFNIHGGFDFLVAPLIDPSYRSSSVEQDRCGLEVISIKIPAEKRCGSIQFANRSNADDAIQRLYGAIIGKQTVHKWSSY